MKPLAERIAAIRSEIDALIDERTTEVAKACPGVPREVIRKSIIGREADCQCRQFLALNPVEA